MRAESAENKLLLVTYSLHHHRPAMRAESAENNMLSKPTSHLKFFRNIKVALNPLQRIF